MEPRGTLGGGTQSSVQLTHERNAQHREPNVLHFSLSILLLTFSKKIVKIIQIKNIRNRTSG